MDLSINLPKILVSHVKWLADKATGDRANLSGANLSGATLSGADLSGATLSGANLSGVVGLAIASDAPERLQAVATAALADNGLNMLFWHTCDTTHVYQAGRSIRPES